MREILMVEDAEADAKLLTRALAAAKVVNPIKHARDGRQALSILSGFERAQQRAIPAVLFLDLKLPIISGFDILSHLQGRTRFSKMLKVVVSDRSDVESIKKAYTLGANSFLTKPIGRIDVEELIKTYRGHWKTKRRGSRVRKARPR